MTVETLDSLVKFLTAAFVGNFGGILISWAGIAYLIWKHEKCDKKMEHMRKTIIMLMQKVIKVTPLDDRDMHDIMNALE